MHRGLYMQNTITDLLELAVDNPAELTTEQASAEFTQAERAFVTQFLADTLAGLVSINAECITDAEDYFVRLTDAQEVMQNLQMLYNTADADSAVFNFTLADAGAALCSYDTEYRDCITEQFTYACVEQAYKTIPAQQNLLHLPARIFASY
jgi:hypothetical protein